MTVIEAIRDFLKTCPLLGAGPIYVDYLPEDPVTFSVDTTPVAPVVKSYIDGASLRQFAFVLATRAYYGAEVRTQLDNLGLFEAFAGWIAEQERSGEYPELGPGRTVEKMEVTTSGYAFAPGVDAARYQIQCRILYRQDPM